VTKDGSQNYVFTPNRAVDGSGNDLTIYANCGDILVFEVSSSAQPFWIKTAPATGTGQGVSGVVNNGSTQAIVQWNTAGFNPATYYYISENTSNMQGEIILVNPKTETRIAGGHVQVSGSIDITGGGLNVVSGSIYVNGVAIGAGGSSAGGIFIATGSIYNTTNNVGITGSLVVSGSITASAITVTSPGSPELYSANNLYLNASNTVVISSSSLRLANFQNAATSAFSPQVGDIYYNTDRNKFMGYIGSSWIDFTSGSMTPPNSLALSGSKSNGILTYDSSTTAISQNLVSFDATTAVLQVTGSTHLTNILKLEAIHPLPTGQMGMFAVSSSGATVKPYFYDGSAWNALY